MIRVDIDVLALQKIITSQYERVLCAIERFELKVKASF